MTTHHVSPKLLLQFYRGEKVPPLIKKYDFESKFQQRPLRQKINSTNMHQHGQSRYQYQNLHSSHSQTVDQLDRQLEYQIQQNRQMRLIVKELEEKLQKLKQINEELVVRVQELERRNSSLTDNSDNLRKAVANKIKAQTYDEISSFLKLMAEKFTQSLMHLKMSPAIQNKIEEFLQQILNINSFQVKKGLQPSPQSRKRRLFDQKEADRTIKEIMDRNSKSKQKQRQRKRQFQRQKYDNVLNKLNLSAGSQQPSISDYNVTITSQSPNKWTSGSKSRRTKIFSKGHEEVERSISRDQVRRLNF